MQASKKAAFMVFTTLALASCNEATTQQEAAELIAGIYCESDVACHASVVAGFCADSCAEPADTDSLDACLTLAKPGFLPSVCWLVFR